MRVIGTHTQCVGGGSTGGGKVTITFVVIKDFRIDWLEFKCICNVRRIDPSHVAYMDAKFDFHLIDKQDTGASSFIQRIKTDNDMIWSYWYPVICSM